ncbi:MAG: YheC/YheD family protein [Bacillota bacterium]|jgi:Glutathione synthase/Ribosomal protein S6 modification enzyme (glutaminyl transferase)
MLVMRVFIQIDADTGKPPTIIFPQSLAKRMALSTSLPLRVSFGSRQAAAAVAIGGSSTALIRLNQPLAQTLCLPGPRLAHIVYFRDEHRLDLGPILGVLVSRAYENEPARPFGHFTPFFLELIASGARHGMLVYAFTAEDVATNPSTICGWIYRHNAFHRVHLPLPHAVYNRLSSRLSEGTAASQKLLLQLRNGGVAIFNERFLDKWTVHRKLAAVPELAPHLPDTRFYQGPATVKELLDRYGLVYLKPSNGSLGRGIYRISKERRRFVVSYTTLSGTIRRVFSRWAQAAQFLVPRLGKRPYLVQQGLLFLTYQQAPVDFRVLVQKGRTGAWGVTSIVARTGPAGGIVTNLARGGASLPAAQALTQALPLSAPRPSLTALRQKALLVAKSIEQTIPGHFAELGIDLAVDVHGKIWVIEANAKPSKTEERPDEPGSPAALPRPRPSALRLADYAWYVYRQQITRSEPTWPPGLR